MLRADTCYRVRAYDESHWRGCNLGENCRQMPAVVGGAKGLRYLRRKMLEGDQSVITAIVLGYSAFRGLLSPPPVV